MNKEKNCNNDAGKVAPIINRERCEGKAACFNVCPFDVFEIAKISKEERNKLSLRGKLKAWVHGGKQAFVVKPDQCHGCNLCVNACPEQAITLG